MKLRRLELYQVGPHNGLVLENVGDGLTVVCGPNEAGKSSLLAGLRGVLFGLVVSAEPKPAWRQGAHGVAVVVRDGEIWRIERSLDRRRRPLVQGPDGRRLSGEDALRRALPELGLVEDVAYQSVFTFQLADLVALAPDQGQIRDQLFTVGRLGLRSAAAVEDELARRTKALFNPDPRARRPRLTQCLQEWRELMEARSRADDSASAYQAVQAELERRRAALAEVAEKRAVETERCQRQRWLLGLYPLFLANVRAAARLQAVLSGIQPRPEGLGSPADGTQTGGHPTSANGVAAPDGADLGTVAQAALERLRAWAAAAAEWSWRLQQLEDLLARVSEETAAAAATATTFTWFQEPALAGLPVPTHDLVALEALVQEEDRLLQQLEANQRAWQEAQVVQADRRKQLLERGFVEADAVQELARRQAEAQRRLAELTADAERVQVMLAKVRERTALERERAALAQAPRRRRPVARRGVLWLAGGLALAAAVAVGLRQEWTPAGSALLAALLALWVAARAGAGRAPADREQAEPGARLAELDERLARVEADLEPLAARLVHVDVERLEEPLLLDAGAAVAAKLRQQEQVMQQAASNEQLVRAWQAACAQVQRMDEARRAARAALVAHRRALADWCREHGGAGDPPPQRARQVLEEFRRWAELWERRQASARNLDEARKTLAELAAWWSARGLADPPPVHAEDASSLRSHVNRAQARLNAWRRQQEDKLRELEEALLNWRRAHAEAVGRAGGEEDWVAASAQLRGETEESIRARLDDALETVGRLTERHDDLVKQMGELEARLRDWPSGTDLEWQVAALSEQKDLLAKQWAVYRLAQALFKEAAARHEALRQPRALRWAGEILARATDGRYPQLRVEESADGQRRLFVVDAQGQRWDPVALSRGTRELTAFAIRLALIADYRERGVHLPVVWDDPLVNLDPLRRSRLLRLILEVSEQQQILYLTCHPSVVEWARQQGVDVRMMSSLPLPAAPRPAVAAGPDR
ncbi:AAA family ATPase [Alicyclobacillus shizuokensis]|uniref:AAA family ATPase n=1 Tax=Alicyclobacillus shizuokensis TaxID=392014 RepID=UPI000835F03B|nr:AAA family ATPase [Alicyclobacillus shizuokensis]